MWLGVWQLLTSKHLSGLEQPKSAEQPQKATLLPVPCPTTPTNYISIYLLQKLLLIKLQSIIARKHAISTKGQNKKLLFWITHEAIKFNFKQKQKFV